MAVNRLEPDILTLHSSDGTKTLQIKVKGESLSVSVTDEIGLSTSTEIEGITPDQAATVGYALVYWSNCGKLNFQNHKAEHPLHRMKEPIRSFFIKGSRPELKGLEVAFDSEGYCALRCAANPRLGFTLTQQSSLDLADLIRFEQYREHFYLADGKEE